MDWRLLDGLSGQDTKRVLDSTRRRQFGADEVIFREGEIGTSLHLLETGRVAIRVTTPAGESATLTVLGAGEAFGEMALMRRSSLRSATAVALEPVTTLSLQQEAFQRLCAEHPRVEHMLAGIFAARVDRLSTHLVEALYLSVDKRICRRLLDLCRLYGAAGARSITIPMTQEDIAGLAGTTRPTVNTFLRQLQAAGIVALARGRLDVLDIPALVQAAR